METRNFLKEVGSILMRLETYFAKRIVFLFAALALGATVAISFRDAIGGDWHASGNDMRFILPQLREGRPADWITGPWAGEQIFKYYRPVTSIAMWLELQAFGEDQAAWQAVSLGAHSLSTTLLACFLFALFGSAIPAIVGASVWAFRWRMFEAIEWVPAQTDIFAGLFSILGLVLFVVALRSQRVWMMCLSALAMLLAIGCKEVAFVVPGVAIAIAIFEPDLSSQRKITIISGAATILLVSILVRIFALNGIGFLPGQPVHGTLGASEITVGKIVANVVSFVLPAPLTKGSIAGALTAWVAGVGFVGSLLAFRVRWTFGLAVFTVTFAAVTFLFDDPAYWHIPAIRGAVFAACFSAALIAASLLLRPAQTLTTAICGLILALPLYHVVYNKAGNVRYVPEVFWAMAWTVLLAGILERIAQRWTTSKITADAHSGEPS